MFHAISPHEYHREDGEFACGLRYPGNRRRHPKRTGTAQRLTGAERFCPECVAELALYCMMADVDVTEWVDATGRWGMCKHYNLPGLFEALEDQDAGWRPRTPTPRRVAGRRTVGAPQVGLVHAFCRTSNAGTAVSSSNPQPSTRATVAPPRGRDRCDFELTTFSGDTVPLASKPPTQEADTCSKCLVNVQELLHTTILCLDDVQWRDEGGVLRGAPALIQRLLDAKKYDISRKQRRREDRGGGSSNPELHHRLRRQGAELLAMEKRTRSDD